MSKPSSFSTSTKSSSAQSLADPIANRFDQAAARYEDAAIIQNQAAEQFDQWLEVNCVKVPKRITEIGCGTGFLTRRLQQRYPQAHLHITDLSPAMLSHCRHSLPATPHLSFAVADGRTAKFDLDSDWLVSTFCFQWFDDLPKRLAWHYQQTRVLAFSVLLDRSFYAWQTAHTEHNLNAGLRVLPNWDQLRHFLATLPHQRLLSKRLTLKQEHANGLDFLRELKKIGAHQARANYQPINLRPILKQFADGFTAEYDIGFFWIEK